MNNPVVHVQVMVIRGEEVLNKHSLVDRLGPSIDRSLSGTYTNLKNA